MASPVELTDLPVATSAVNGDLMLLRKGLTDYQINVTAIRNIDLTVLTSIPSPAANDLLFLQRGSQNYSVLFSQVGFLQGTQAWFYSNTAPVGWTIIPGTGDKLIGVSDGVNNYNGAGAGTQNGTWQQVGVPLSIQQIPNHNHFMAGGNSQSNSHCNYLFGAQFQGGTSPTFPQNACLGIPQGQGDNNLHNNYGACLAHDHGATWRPFANIGIIASKNT